MFEFALLVEEVEEGIPETEETPEIEETTLETGETGETEKMSEGEEVLQTEE